MKHAVVRQRRGTADGRQFVNVVCPVCDHRHWLQAAETGSCPRKPGIFTIANTTKKEDT
jgi:hypothetical protein